MKMVIKHCYEAIKKYRKQFTLCIILSILLALINISIPYATRLYIQKVSRSDSLLLLLIGVCVFAALYLIRTAIDIISYRSLDSFGGEYMSHLSCELEERMANASYGAIEYKKRGMVRNVIFSDVLNVFLTIGHHMPSLLCSCLIIILSLVMSSMHDLKASILIGAAAIVSMLLTILSKKMIVNASKETNIKMKKYDALCTEFVDMLPYIMTNPVLEYYKQKTKRTIHDFIETSKKADVPIVFWNGAINSYHSLFSIFLSAILVLPVVKDSVVDLVYFTLLSSIVMDETQKMAVMYQQVSKNIPSFTHVDALLNLKKINGVAELLNVDSIIFDRVSFHYDPNPTDVLSDFCCFFKKGDTVRVKGDNGCGKSTFYKLLTGMYEVQEGQVLMNHGALQEYSRESIKKQIVYISQDEQFLNESLDDYLQIIAGHEIDQDLLSDIFQRTNFESTDKVISGNGASLSGGQRKKISIMKLLLLEPNASVIILDEVASGLDKESKRLYFDIVNRIAERKDKIIFITEHTDDEHIHYTADLTIPSR